MNDAVEPNGTFQWVAGEASPWVSWQTLERRIKDDGRLRDFADVTEMGALIPYRESGYVLLGNSKGEVIIVNYGDGRARVSGFTELVQLGFLHQEDLEEIQRQIQSATEKRDADTQAMYENEARIRIRERLFAPPLQTLEAAVKSIDSSLRIDRLEDADFIKYLAEIRESLDEVERLQALTDQESFEELLAKTVARVTESYGNDASNKRLVTLNEVKSPLDLQNYFKEWER